MAKPVFRCLSRCPLGCGLLLLACLCLLAAPASAGGRIALVIGNGSYRHTHRLTNPVPDARAVARALSRLGFQVQTVLNENRRGIERAFQRFSRRLAGAEVALLFYSGHGLQVGERNYLVPTDAKLEHETDLEFELMDLGRLLEPMQSRARVAMVFLDACRNNPFTNRLTSAGRAVGRGLYPIQTVDGDLLLVYATSPGRTADDGRAGHSPFTAALLEHIETPGLEVQIMLKRVIQAVEETTGGQQRPWQNASLKTEVYLAGSAPPPPPAAMPPPRPPRFSPYVDAGAGVLLAGRRFELDGEECYDLQAQSDNLFRYGKAHPCPAFSGQIAGGLHLDLTIYPWATSSRPVLRGFGFGGTVDLFFWRPSTLCNRHIDGQCQQPGEPLGTSHVRAETGLRWTWRLRDGFSSPLLQGMLQYGIHSFSLEKSRQVFYFPGSRSDRLDDHGLPDVRYQYLDLAVLGAMPLRATQRWSWAIALEIHVHVMLDYGDVAQSFVDIERGEGGYGPVEEGYGLRLGLTPLDVRLRGVTLRLSGFYERIAMRFRLGQDLTQRDRTAEEAALHLSRGATDQLYGATLQAGYQY